MAREKFIDYKPRPDAVAIIEWANRVLAQYAAAGLVVTLRQLYYVGVAANVYANREESYTRLGDIITNARMAGMIDWDMIEDRGRWTSRTETWANPEELLKQSVDRYCRNKWDRQPCYVEVMIEKQALEGVFLPPCQRLEVPFTANKGYSSASALYEAGHRFRTVAYESAKKGKPRELHVIYFGDHDPSGIDMTRDVQERLSMFALEPVHVHRAALNIDQVEELHLPENPTKTDDSRAAKYIEEFGNSSWELDAIPVDQLITLVNEAVLDLRDDNLWEIACREQERERQQMSGLVEAFQRSRDETTDLDDLD